SLEDAQALVEAGVARVVIGTVAFGETPLRELVGALGSRLAVSVDVADGVVRTDGWLDSSQLTAAEALERGARAGVETVVCTAIPRDGPRGGPDLELLRDARGRYDGRLLAAGGIRDAVDADAVRALGLDGAVVGRAWLEGAV